MENYVHCFAFLLFCALKVRRIFSKVIIFDHDVGLFALEVADIDIVSFSEEPKPPPENLPFSNWVSGMFTSTKGEFFILSFDPLQKLVASVTTLIIIDDSTFTRKNFRRIVQKHPSFHIVSEAKNGFEGLKKIQDFQPDIVIWTQRCHSCLVLSRLRR